MTEFKYPPRGIADYPTGVSLLDVQRRHPRAAIIRRHVNGSGTTVLNQPMDAIGHWSATVGAQKEAA